MTDLLQQFVNWLPQFSNTPAGLRINVNASHVWAFAYASLSVLVLLIGKQCLHKFFAWKKARRIAIQERQDEELKNILPDPWFSL